MLIYINEQPEHFQSNISSLYDLLYNLKESHPKGIAVAVNAEIVPRDFWKNFTLSENDHITLIQATQGG